MNKRRLGLLAIATLVLAALFSVQASAKGDEGRTILEFDTMVGVTGPYVGGANPIRTINGGGVPWVIRSGEGELKQSGKLKVEVQGLVLATTLANPVATFKATVSCQTIDENGAAVVKNVSTAPVPATTGPASAGGGNAEIEATLALPQPCIAPIIFVANGGNGAWFSATGF